MSESFTKAAQYCKLTAECVKLAEISPTDAMRAYYKKMAAAYLQKARTELRYAQESSKRKSYNTL
jgi:hypothetical protein